MPTRAMSLGWRGEEVAKVWLEVRGFVHIATHFRTRYGEIDLVMLDGETTVFVEVKTRRTQRFGSAEDSVDERKMERLGMAGDAYLQTHPDVRATRFDLVVLERMSGRWQIRYLAGIS